MAAEVFPLGPNGGHDRLPVSGDLRDYIGNHDAVLEERYTHMLGEFRFRYLSKLKASCNMRNGYGWAIFDNDDDGNVATLGSREVLLISRLREGESRRNAGKIPLIRLVTNEPYMAENGRAYLTEDASFLENGSARYHLDASLFNEEGVDLGERDRENNTGILKSYSPLFFVLDQGPFLISDNTGLYTPKLVIPRTEEDPIPIAPLGEPDNITDRLYVLERSTEILDSVMARPPVHWFGRY